MSLLNQFTLKLHLYWAYLLGDCACPAQSWTRDLPTLQKKRKEKKKGKPDAVTHNYNPSTQEDCCELKASRGWLISEVSQAGTT